MCRIIFADRAEGQKRGFVFIDLAMNTRILLLLNYTKFNNRLFALIHF